jgi:ComF family protein
MSLLGSLIDLVYPPRCLVCRAFLMEPSPTLPRPRVHFCPECLSRFSLLSSPLCPVCSRPFVSEADRDHLCEDCLRKRPFFESVAGPYVYEGALMTAIHHFKYGCKTAMAGSLGPLLGRYAAERFGGLDEPLVMPIPLHPRRLRKRGFNQSLLLARHVVGALLADLDFLNLRRVRHTAPQTGLGRDERRRNVRGAFLLKAPDDVKGRTVLLVDDVMTTGSTLNECARILRKAGCRDVFSLVLARASNP